MEDENQLFSCEVLWMDCGEGLWFFSNPIRRLLAFVPVTG